MSNILHIRKKHGILRSPQFLRWIKLYFSSFRDSVTYCLLRKQTNVFVLCIAIAVVRPLISRYYVPYNRRHRWALAKHQWLTCFITKCKYFSDIIMSLSRTKVKIKVQVIGSLIETQKTIVK